MLILASARFSTFFVVYMGQGTKLGSRGLKPRLRVASAPVSEQGRATLEKIRELAALLASGIEDYDEQVKVLQTERLKYIRLTMTDGFGTSEGESKDSWLLHLKGLEDSLTRRRNALRQAILMAGDDMRQLEE